MKIRCTCALILALQFHGGADAADTPLNSAIPEGIVCKVRCSINIRELPVGDGDLKTRIKPGSYHYHVQLPKGYYASAQKRFPAVFVAAPGGNAGMKNIAGAMDKRRWIVIMLVESRNDAEDGVPSGNFVAAHDDATKRFRIQEGMKFATGLSGGARVQSLNVGLRPGFAGLILQGAGFIQNPATGRYRMAAMEQKDICVYGIFGVGDPNRLEMGMLERELPRHTLHRFATFNGGHEWAPADRMEDALDFCELNGLKKLNTSGDGAAFLNARMDEALDARNAKFAGRFERYVELKRLQSVIGEQSGGGVSVFKDRPARIEAMLRALSAATDVRGESDARTEYESIEADESLALAQAAIGGGSSDLKALAKRYESCAKKYPNAIFGQKAAAKSRLFRLRSWGTPLMPPRM